MFKTSVLCFRLHIVGWEQNELDPEDAEEGIRQVENFIQTVSLLPANEKIAKKVYAEIFDLDEAHIATKIHEVFDFYKVVSKLQTFNGFCLKFVEASAVLKEACKTRHSITQLHSILFRTVYLAARCK